MTSPLKASTVLVLNVSCCDIYVVGTGYNFDGIRIMDIRHWNLDGIMDCNLHRVFIWILFDHDSRVYSFVTFLAGIVGLEEL